MKKFILFCLSAALISNFTISKAYLEPSEMSIDEKLGQMMCLEFRYWEDEDLNKKTTANKEKTSLKPVKEINNEIKNVISKYHIGNIILFSQNFENKNQTKKLVSDLQKSATESGNPPLIIAVDQEGGKVERFSFGRNKLKNNGELKTSSEAFKKGQKIAEELSELGINCDFAPVVDINSNPKNPVINVRSFGNNPKVVAEFGKSFLDGLHSKKIIATAKHFPGHGDTEIDSHFSLPKVNKSLEDLKKVELKPFKNLVDAGVDIVMIAHISLPKIESKTITSKKDGKQIFLPATLSNKVLKDILRKQIGFSGVIITDAMNMKAISENFSKEEAVKRAIAAGADIICMPVEICSKHDVYKLDNLFKNLKDAISRGEISEAEINSSTSRIMELKEKYCQNINKE